MAPGSDRADRLVLVVHGVGDPAPGATVGAFARALASHARQDLDPVEEVLWLPDGDGREVETFPCHLRRIRSGSSSETLLGEVHWADVSAVGGGALGAVRGFFSVVFGLRHVARNAADPRRADAGCEPAAAWLRRFSAAIGYLLRGPVLASNLMLALMLAVVAVLLSLSPGPERTVAEPLAGGLLVAVGLIGLAAGTLAYRRRRGRPGGDLALWTAICGVAYLLQPVLAHWVADWWPVVAQHHQRRPFQIPGWDSRAIDLSFYGVQLIDLVGLCWIVAAVLILLATAAWALARRRLGRRYAPGVNAAQAINTLTVGLWFLAIPAFWVVVNRQLPAEAKIQYSEILLKEGLKAMGLNWALAFLLSLVGLGTYAARLLWARRRTAASYRRTDAAPRLLLGVWLERALIALPVGAASAILSLAWMAGQQKTDGVQGADLSGLFDQGNVIAFQVAIFLSAVAAALLPRLRVGLDVGVDVINHFRREPDRTIPAGPRPGDDEEGARPRTAYVRRERIRERLRQVLEVLVERARPGRLTIVAHSQGTVAAVDVLAEGLPPNVRRVVGECGLVTMGSPLTHLYQHYFPNEYPPLADSRWDGLRAAVGADWLNLFRIDDFVGTGIEPGAAWPVDQPVDRGGHTGYWTDRQVIEHLVGPASRVKLLG